MAETALYLLSETWFNLDRDFQTTVGIMLNRQDLPQINTIEILEDFDEFIIELETSY